MKLSIKGGGGRRFAPQAKTCFSHAPSLPLFWVSEGFTQLFVKPKPTFSRGARGRVGLRSCCTGGLMSSPHPWLGCSTDVPGASTPLQLHFSPHFCLGTPPAFIHRSPLKRRAIPPLCFTFSSGHQIRGSDF